MCEGGGSVGFFFFQAEDGIRDLVRSRGLGDVYKRQSYMCDRLAVMRMSEVVETLTREDLVARRMTHDYSLSLIHI